MRADSVPHDLLREVAGPALDSWTVVSGPHLALLASADVLLVASGTATLEGVLAAVPMVVVYRVNPITYAVGRLLVKVPHVAMANIVSDDGSGARAVPELIQGEATPERVAAEAAAFLDDPARAAEARRRLARGRERLGLPGAADRAASALLHVLGTRRAGRSAAVKDLRRLVVLFRPHRRGAMVAAAAMLGVAFFTGVVAYLIGPLFDDVLTPEARLAVQSETKGMPGVGSLVGEKAAPKRTAIAGALDRGLAAAESALGVTPRSRTLILPVLLFAAFFLKNLCAFAAEYRFNAVGLAFVRDLRRTLYEKVLGESGSFFAKNTSGDLISRLTGDVDRIQNLFGTDLADLIQSLATLAVLAVVVVSLSPQLTGVALLIAPAIVLPVVFIARRLRSLSKASRERMGDLTSVLSETLRGVRVVQAYGAERLGERALLGRERADVPPLPEGGAGDGAVVAPRRDGLDPRVPPPPRIRRPPDRLRPDDPRDLHLVRRRHDDDVSAVQAGDPDEPRAAVRARLGAPAFRGPRRAGRRSRRRGRIAPSPFHPRDPFPRCFLRLSGAGPGPPRHRPRRATGVGHGSRRSLRRREDDARQSPSTLHGRDGRRRHRGRDATSVGRRWPPCAEQIGLVTQDVILFDDTVRRNVAYGRTDVPEERVVAALEAASALGFVEALPQGLDTRVGESGARLSGGQRQRLAIARALLKDPPILILDEATSSLDTESERAVQEALERLMAGRTVLVIAHRLSTVRRADQILVLSEGRITERGRHADLLAAGGLYRRLHDLQAFEPEASEEVSAR